MNWSRTSRTNFQKRDLSASQSARIPTPANRTLSAGKLSKGREVLLAIYDFPAEHWKHNRTNKPIESTFATVRRRTGKTKGCLARKTGLVMALKLIVSSQTNWRKIDQENRMPQIFHCIAFEDAIKQLQDAE